MSTRNSANTDVAIKSDRWHGVSIGNNSGCTVYFFPWVWKIVNVNEQVKWLLEMEWMSDCYDYYRCLIIYWPTLKKRAEKIMFHVCKMKCERDECVLTNYIVQLKFPGIECEFVSECEWMRNRYIYVHCGPHQNKIVESIFSILVWKLNQNPICLNIFLN